MNDTVVEVCTRTSNDGRIEGSDNLTIKMTGDVNLESRGRHLASMRTLMRLLEYFSQCLLLAFRQGSSNL